ncbi:hydrogenase [Calidifontimicrobium sp. SYSU G02091]|uniref:hydrogenase n=1 Tax=Calidifontimicrobium sp. SYSU G02091 TaxID=2926421 RepID=UPI001F530F67|nr:hydrogenase [Calidifontimicrobium sp. SYSU G02091]MCI1191894.1 hydrogenase [Calidifontimicrobium sp. SYSU G02091]
MTATTLPAVMQRLLDRFDATRIEADTLAAFLERPGTSVLLLAGDPVQFPEGLDVAVVLPELRSALAADFAIGVVAPGSQDAVARRYGVQRWPSLVFLRDGQYVTTVSGMHDWTEYLKLVEAALAMPVSRAPTIGIPVVSAHATPGCH